jgi:SAM-dependent methyltransferase
VESLQIDSDTFDFIISQGPLSYTPNPIKMITEMYRLLKHKGSIWIECYNSLGWSIEMDFLPLKIELASVDEKLIQMPDWDYPVRVFSMNRVNKLLTEAGFKNIKMYGNHVILNSMSLDHIYSTKYDAHELEMIKDIELNLSQNSNTIGISKNIEFLALKE